MFLKTRYKSLKTWGIQDIQCFYVKAPKYKATKVFKKKKKKKEKKKKDIKSLFSRCNDNLIDMALVHMSLVRWSTFSCTITFNNNGSSLFLLLGFINKNIGIDCLKVQVGEVHNLAMMFHRPSAQKLKAFVVLDELEVSKVLSLQELINHFLTFLISSKKSSLNFIIFFGDKKFLHLQRLVKLFDLPFCLCSFIYSLNQIFPQP